MKTIRELLVVASCLIASVCAGALEQRAAKGLSSLPVAEQANISAAIGDDLHNYHVIANGDGFDARISRQSLITHFSSAGVEVRTGTAHWRMALRGYGYGDRMTAVRTAAPHATSNRVEYRRGALTEWYENGPLGLEQGFTINERPGEPNGQPLAVALAISGSVTAKVDQQRTALSLIQANKKAELRYTGLTAYDSAGKNLRAWLEVRGGQLLLKADDAKARYPIVIDPWVQLAELTASDATDYSFLGVSVAMSGDTVVVGASNEGNQNQGAAYVFVRPRSGWRSTSQFTAKLTPRNQQTKGLFGGSVSISGNVIVVGAENQTVNYKQSQGAAYVFVKPASGWKTTSEFTAKLTASDGAASDSFGSSVSLAGSTLVVGAFGATINGNQNQGAAYVFVKSPGGWKTMTQTAKMTSSDGQASDFFGSLVSISAHTIAVDAYGHNQQQGEEYVFVKPSSGWSDMTESAKLTASDGHPGDLLGAVTIDGNTVVAGAMFAAIHGQQQQGAAYVFVEPRGGWKGSLTQTAKLTASNGKAGDWFGASVSLSGATLAIGAPNVNKDQGAGYIFVRPPKGWKNSSRFAAELTASNGAQNDDFGFAVCVNGTTIVSGAPNVIINNTEVGAVYIFADTE